ncbi:MAG: hypothetical protein ACRC9K_02400 [Afipia sp.]
MTLKLGLKIGNIEFSFEGSAELFEAKIEPTFKEFLDLGKGRLGPGQAQPTPSRAQYDSGDSSASIPPMTVKAIAAKLGGDSGPELILSAMASLVLIKEKELVTRQEIIDEMKSATGYYKPSYSGGNLTKNLDRLVKNGAIIESSKDTYSLKEATKSDMEQKLAQ